MSTEPEHALIVGGGLVGKAAALALARVVPRVTLCGSRPAAALPGRGHGLRVYAFNAASRGLLESLRVWESVPRLQPVLAMRVAGDGAALRFDAATQGVEALAWIAEGDAVEGALDLALRFERGVAMAEAGATGARRSAGRWRVELDGGTGVDADLLVGADGRDSRVRAWAGLPLHRKAYGQTGVVCNFRCSGRHEATAFQLFGDEGVIALLPLPAQDGVDHVSLVWSAPDALAAELLAAGPEALARRVAERLDALGASGLGELEASGGVAGWPLVLQRADAMVGVGAALVGDAAHVVHPLAGHGLNLGLQDVQALAATLGARGGAPIGDARLLRRYARARAEQVLALETATDGLTRLYAPGLRWLAPLRAVGLAVTDALPGAKRLLAGYASGLLS